jgi:hypothetical protein
MAGIRNSLHVETQPRQDNQADLNRTVLSVPSRESGANLRGVAPSRSLNGAPPIGVACP